MQISISRLLIALLLFTTEVFAQAPVIPSPKTQNEADITATTGAITQVILKTNLGNIEVALYPDRAPVTVKNFLSYVDKGFYDDTIFHRVIPGFIIQGGGFVEGMERKESSAPIINESFNGLTNQQGTLSMARTSDPNSATSQFFINLGNNAFLNAAPNNPGYTVFGEVTKGMDVVILMSSAKTGTVKQYKDVPLKPIHLVSAKRKSIE